MGRESIDVDQLFQRYGPMVLRRCRQLLREEDEALDVAQDVFVRLLENRDRLDASYGAFAASRPVPKDGRWQRALEDAATAGRGDLIRIAYRVVEPS